MDSSSSSVSKLIKAFIGYLKVSVALSMSLLLVSCGGGDSASMIDSLLGGLTNTPVLTAVPTQIIQQTQLLEVDINNVKEFSPGNDEDMTYTCSWTRVTGGVVGAAQDCVNLPNGTASFSMASGKLEWTPSTNELGQFEVTVRGTNKGSRDQRTFIVDVRLKFGGIESLTNVQGDRMTIGWTPNPDAVGYQILRRGSDGNFSIFHTVTDPSIGSIILTNLVPLTAYNFRVAAVDSLGSLDNNTVTLNAVTADLIRLEVTAVATDLSPGQSTAVTVRLKDNAGNYLNTSGLTVGLAMNGVGTSSGTFAPTVDLGNGIYTSVFTATTPGTVDSLTASLTQFYYVEQRAVMHVRPLQIELTSSAAKVNPNRSVTVTARLRDFTGTPVTSGGQNLHFTISGGTSTVTFSPTLDLGTGTYTATLTGALAGTAVTLGAYIDTPTNVYSTTTVQVMPYSIEITSALNDLSVTRSTTVTARVKDWQGTYLSTGGQGLAFAVQGSTGIVNLGTTTDVGNGTYTATVSGVSLGSIVITASMNPSFAVTQTATIVVRKLRLEFLTSSANLMPTQVATLTGRVKDWQGNVVGVGGQALDFSASGGTSSGTISSVTDNSNGTYTATFTAAGAGTTVNISGSISDSYQVDTTAQITVQRWRVSVALSASSISTGQSVTATVTVSDYLGNQAAAGGQVVSMLISGGTSSATAGAITDNGNGTYTTQITGNSTGTAMTISASLQQSHTVVQTATLTVTPVHITVTVAQPQMNPAGTSYVYAQLKDSAGTNLTGGSYTISFSYSGGTSTGSFSAVTNQGSGLYRATFTGATGGTPISITAASATTAYVVNSTQTIEVVPWSLRITSATTAVTVGQSVALTGRVYDYTGAVVTTGGQGLAMALATTGVGSLTSVTDVGDGTYTASFSAVNVGSTAVTGTVSSSYVLTSSVTLVSSALHLAVTVAQSQMNPAGSAFVYAQLKDAAGVNLTGGSYTITFAYSGGTSTGSFSAVTNQGNGLYRATFTGATGGTAVAISAVSATTAYVVDSTQTIEVVPWSLKITSTATAVTVGQSITLTGKVYDYTGALVTTGGKGFAMGLATTGVGSLTSVSDLGDGSYTASFTATNVGSTSVTGNISSSYSLTSTVTLNSSAVHLALSVTQNSLNPSEGVTVTAIVKDAFGNSLFSSGYTIGFSYSGGTSTGSVGSTINLGTGAYTTVFTGNVAGSATTITANASVPYVVDTTVNLTVVPWNIVITASKTDYAIYEGGLLTAQIKNWQGNNVTSGGKGVSLALSAAGIGAISSTTDNSDGTYAANFQANNVGSVVVTANMSQSFTTTIAPTLTVGKVFISVTVGAGLTSSNVNSGNTIVARATLKNGAGTLVTGTGYTIVFANSGGSSTLSLDTAVTEVSTGVYEMTYRGVTAGTALTISASASVSYQLSSSATITVLPSTVISASGSSLTVSANSVRSGGSPVTVTATLKDAAGNFVPGLTGVTFASSTGANIGTGSFANLTDQGSGVYTAEFTGIAQGTLPTVLSVSSGGVTVAQKQNVTVTSGIASSLTLAGPTTAVGGVCEPVPFYLQFFDSAGNPTTLSSNTSFSVANLGYGELFSDSDCLNKIATVNVTANSTSSNNFYFRSYSPSSYQLNFSATGITQSNTLTTTVSSVLSWMGVAGKMDLYGTGGVNYAPTSQEGGFSYVQAVNVAVEGSRTYLYASDTTNHNVQKFDITNPAAMTVKGSFGKIVSIKGVPTGGSDPSYCTNDLRAGQGINGAFCTGGQFSSGSGDAQFNQPLSSTTMLIGGVNYTFIADSANHRIMKYNADTGAFIGWNGMVGTAVTSCTGGTSAGVGRTTPGWCLGGTATASVATTGVSGSSATNTTTGGNQYRSPNYLTNDGTNLYLSDLGNNRLLQIDPTNGNVLRWMGRISSTAQGNGVNGTTGLTCLTNSQADGNNHAIEGGWTPSWCTGGAAMSAGYSVTYPQPFAAIYPHNLNLRGIYFYSDGTYNFMVTVDASLHRLTRYFCGAATATPNCSNMASRTVTSGANSGTYWPGQYFGFTGYVATVPTNSGVIPLPLASLFNGVYSGSTGVMTNGWSFYGGARENGGNGALNTPIGMAGIGTTVYIANLGSVRIERFNILTGQAGGWVGRISTTPTGGSPGCAGANTGSITPGWCIGGSATQGTATGGFSSIIDITTDGTYLYSADREHNRITMNLASSGAAIGAIGLRLNNQPTTWSTASFGAPNAIPASTGLSIYYQNRDRVMNAPDSSVIVGQYMYVSDTSNHRVKRYKWLDGSFQGWIGSNASSATTGGDEACIGALVGGFTPGWCTGGGFAATSGFGFNAPRGLASDGTYLYVADSGNQRIVRVQLDDASFQGWIGMVGTSPSDGTSTCANAPAQSPTPGWCLGGAAIASSSASPNFQLGGFRDPYGIAAFKDTDDKWYLLVTDGNNHRVQKIEAANPAPANTKWIGATASAACGANANAMVLSWCSTSQITTRATDVSTTPAFTENGAFNFPRAITVDTTSSPIMMYVSSNNGRIIRFNATTGKYEGWVGYMNSITTAGCELTGATATKVTPSWCRGGQAAAGASNGQMSASIGGVYTDATHLFVADTNNHRIQKFNKLTGEYVGWVGRVLSPTASAPNQDIGGPTGCSGLSAGDITPAWCTGGTSKMGYLTDPVNKKSAFDTPIGITGMGSYLYITDSLNGRIISMPKD